MPALDPNDFTIGAGEMSFAAFKSETDQTPGAFRFIGDVPTFSLNREVQELEKKGNTRGIRSVVKTLVLEENFTGSLVTESVNFQNLAYYLSGEAREVAQVALTGESETFAGVKAGDQFQLGQSDARPSGVRGLANVTVGALVEGTDYVVHAEIGMIEFLKDAATATVTYDAAANTRIQVIPTGRQVEGALKFISYASGRKVDYYIPYATLAASGELNIITEEWQQVPLSFKVSRLRGLAPIYIDGRPAV